MTAVEWLVEQIKSDQNQKALSSNEWMDVIEQAKEIEKENTIAFGYRCIGEVDSELGDLVYKKVPEEVYNETYGSKGSDEQLKSKQ